MYEVQYEHLTARGPDGLYRWRGVMSEPPTRAPEGARIVSTREISKPEDEMAKQKSDAAEQDIEPRPRMSWSAAKFRSVARAALVAASTDTERPHLCAVALRRLNGVLTVSATDGTWLLRWTEPEGQTDEKGDPVDRTPFECVIPRRTLESFVDATKKHLELERVNLTGQGHRWQLETIIDVCKCEFLQVPESFPPLDNVIPKTVAPSCSAIGVGADMLARVAKAFALATGEPKSTVYWQFSGDAQSPLLCTSPMFEELLAVVMPRRLEADANAVPTQRHNGNAERQPEAAAP